MVRQMKTFVINLARALRLPFITASILPFILGSIAGSKSQNIPVFLLGLLAVVSMHLSANLINDYADSKSGADWQDRHFYGFFGGSKLIQEGVFTEKFYLKLAIFFALSCTCAVIALSIILKNSFVISIFTAILLLAWSYSMKPFQFSYNRIGEVIIFILFGPAVVMGGYFLQSGIFPDLKSFALSLPFGFLTTAILYSNEIPDLADDKLAHKMTWAGMAGQSRGYVVYCLLMVCAFLSVVFNAALGFIPPAALFSLLAIFLAVRAAFILKRYPKDKTKLMESSKITILIQSAVGLILIITVGIWPRS